MTRSRGILQCRIADGRGHELCRVPVRNDVGDWPQTLGSGPDDGIRVDLAGIPESVVLLHVSGRHLQVTARRAGVVCIRGERLGQGESRRTDGRFTVGDLTVEIVHDGTDEECD